MGKKKKRHFTSLLIKDIASIGYIYNKNSSCIQVLSVIHNIISNLSGMLLQLSAWWVTRSICHVIGIILSWNNILSVIRTPLLEAKCNNVKRAWGAHFGKLSKTLFWVLTVMLTMEKIGSVNLCSYRFVREN